MALIWPGVPVSDWAIMRPRASNTPQARSCVSRTTVLKAVRISATCCSLTTAISRKKDGVSIRILHHCEVHPERCSIWLPVALIPEVNQFRILGREGGLFLQ